MNISSNTRKLIIVSLILTALLEVFVFNRNFWRFLFAGETITPQFYLENGEPLEYGISYEVPGNLLLVSDEMDADVRNIHIDIADCSYSGWEDPAKKTGAYLSVGVVDDGHEIYYFFPMRYVTPLVESSEYIPMEPFGHTHYVVLGIPDHLDSITFNSIDLNVRVPFAFSPLRVLMLFVMAMCIGTAFTSDYRALSATPCKRSICIGASILFALITILVLLFLQNQTMPVGASFGYADLAEAFTEGRLYIEENTDPVLASMANPYDADLRNQLGATTKWDTVYWNNKFYVYFGVVPSLLFYLPYYLLTGRHLSDVGAACMIDILIVIAGFVLVNALRKRINRSLSLPMYLLLSLSSTLSIGAVLLVKRSAIYYIAIGSGLVFVLFGLSLWISALEDDRLCLWKGMLGSFLLACAVGCRPQLAIASFLGPVVFRHLFTRDKNKLMSLALLILPYIPVAGALMYYNYARFGSPFNFGSNYILTGFDMAHTGMHFSRIPMGIWYYLFHLPHINAEFPYLNTTSIVSGYQGFMFNELMAGGAIALIPLTWLCFTDIRRTTGQKTKDRYLAVRIACYVITLIVVIADTLMCGVTMRYQLDFRLYLVIPALIIAMTSLTGSDEEDFNKRARIIAALCFATILMAALMILCQYESHDYLNNSINPVFYYRLRGFFGG